jgi:hypothetical protein
MDDQEMVKVFVKAWARYTVALLGAEKEVLHELQSEAFAREQVQMIIATELGSDEARRKVAFQLALAEHQTHFQGGQAMAAKVAAKSPPR